MNLHANARTCPNSRELLAGRVIEQGWSYDRAAQAAGVSTRTPPSGWPATGPREPMGDRSSAPRRVPSRTPTRARRCDRALRRLRMTAAEIAEMLGMRDLDRLALAEEDWAGQEIRLEPPEPPNRYERSRPGELVHVDVKKLGRIFKVAGHRVIAGQPVAGKPAGVRRLGVRPRLRRRRHPPCLRRGATRREADRPQPASFAGRSPGLPGHGVVRRGGAHRQRCLLPLGAHAAACRELGIRHLLTRPYRPRTNGKAERFIQTLRWMGLWSDLPNLPERTRALPGWLDHYNYRRPHGSLATRPPAARLAELEQRGG